MKYIITEIQKVTQKRLIYVELDSEEGVLEWIKKAPRIPYYGFSENVDSIDYKIDKLAVALED